MTLLSCRLILELNKKYKNLIIYTTLYGTTMKTTPLPQSAWNDEQAAGSQSQSVTHSDTRDLTRSEVQPDGCASNNDIYKKLSTAPRVITTESQPASQKAGYQQPDFASADTVKDTINIKTAITPSVDCSYKKAPKISKKVPSTSKIASDGMQHVNKKARSASNNIEKNSTISISSKQSNLTSAELMSKIPERVFMNGLIKHTAIALAIIIPLAAFSAYAAPQNLPVNAASNLATSNTPLPIIEPSALIHKSASTPTTVDSVDLEQYAGTWYEIGRLPMYFQRKCASDVTATYTGKVDGSGIDVLNQCRKEDGSIMSANGLAQAVDNSGSKLKVTFLPAWIRWLPVGRADYWVLARDANYQTALVGTPDHKYLWLLARTPNISQQTYTEYRQIAQQQGYDLKEFKLTTQTNQNVNLVP